MMMMMMMMIERCCSFLVIVQGSGVPRQGFPQVDYLFLCDVRFQSYGAWKFPDFAFLHTFLIQKKPKKYFLVTSLYIYTSQRLHHRILGYPLSQVVVEGPKGCILLVGFSRDVWWGNWGPQISPMGNSCVYTMLLHSVSDLDQRRLKARHSEEEGLWLPFGVVNNVPLNFWSQNPQKLQWRSHE